MNAKIKARLEALFAYLGVQLREASTIRGFVMLAGAAGLLGGLSPDVVLPAAMFAAGILGVLLPDKLS
jgi:hypothetical protein